MVRFEVTAIPRSGLLNRLGSAAVSGNDKPAEVFVLLVKIEKGQHLMKH
jgi:hypothetical protein